MSEKAFRHEDQRDLRGDRAVEPEEDVADARDRLVQRQAWTEYSGSLQGRSRESLLARGPGGAPAGLDTARAFQTALGAPQVLGQDDLAVEQTVAPASGAAGPAAPVKAEAGPEVAPPAKSPAEVAKSARARVAPKTAGEAEALAAMNDFSGLDQPGITDALKQMGNGPANKMLSGVPAGSRGTEIFTRLVVAATPGLAKGFRADVAASGAFGWVATSYEAGQVLATANNAGPAERDGILGRLHGQNVLGATCGLAGGDRHGAHLRPMLKKLPTGNALSADQKGWLKAVFDGTSDAQADTLMLAMEVRFDMKVRGMKNGPKKGEKWEAGGLRRSWPLLESLPGSAVEGNSRLDTFERYKHEKGKKTGGFYSSSKNQVGIGYDPDLLEQDNTGKTDEGDTLEKINRFDNAVLHEIGHAVDYKLGASDKHEGEAWYGGWKRLGEDYPLITQEMVANGSGQMAALQGAARAQCEKAFARTARKRKPKELEKELLKESFFKKMSADERKALLADDCVKALESAYDDPWNNGYVPLGNGRCYQESYEGWWTSFTAAARDNKVSRYQFRSPFEWFAESYTTYYFPGAVKGEKLEPKNKEGKAWFDAHVEAAPSDKQGKAKGAKK